MPHKIPNDWESKKLGAIADFINGMAFKPSDWKTAGLPIIRIQNLNGSLEFNYYTKPVGSRYYVNSGDLLFSWSGSRGTSFGPFIWRGVRGILNQHIFRVVANDGADKNFLYHQFRRITEVIERRAHGSAGLVHVTKNELTKFYIELPIDINEQIEIAKILSTWDREIEALGKLIDAKTRRFNGLIYSLTTPSKNVYGWEETSVGKLGDIIKGKGITKKDLSEVGIPCIRYADLYTQYDFVIQEINSFVSSKMADSSQILQYGDIIFAGSGETAEEIGKSAVYLGTHHRVVVGGDTLILRQKICNSNYLAYVLNSPVVNKQKSVLGHGYSVVHLYGKDLKKVRLFLPPADYQKKCAIVLNLAKQEIDLLKQLLGHYHEQKKGLMQKLLTGKIRVKK
jgi:type I restriction enzyme, S subunit